MLSSLLLLYLILNAIIFMIGGPKLIGKLNQWLWKFCQLAIRKIFQFCSKIIVRFWQYSPELFWSIVGIITIIICFIIIF